MLVPAIVIEAVLMAVTKPSEDEIDSDARRTESGS